MPQVALLHSWVGENQCRVRRSLSHTHSASIIIIIITLLLLLMLLFSHRPSMASIPGKSSWCRSRIRSNKGDYFPSALNYVIFNRYFECQTQHQPTKEDKSLFMYLLHKQPIHFWAGLKMSCSIFSQFSRSQLEYVEALRALSFF